MAIKRGAAYDVSSICPMHPMVKKKQLTVALWSIREGLPIAQAKMKVQSCSNGGEYKAQLTFTEQI